MFGRKRHFPTLAGVGRSDAGALVVGLGNPGRRYSGTRHNAGYMAAEVLIRESEVVAEGDWPQGLLAFTRRGPTEFLVLRPRTFMNNSGTAVAPVLKHYGLAPSRLVVVHDDIDIPAGGVKVKKGGGTAGHRGLESLVQSLGSDGFYRVRIGIGRPPDGMDAADYVLGAFSPPEREEAKLSAATAADLALSLVREVEGEEG